MNVGALGQVGSGLSRGDARLNDAGELFALGGKKLGIEPGIDVVNGQVQSFKDEKGRFIQALDAPWPCSSFAARKRLTAKRR